VCGFNSVDSVRGRETVFTCDLQVINYSQLDFQVPDYYYNLQIKYTRVCTGHSVFLSDVLMRLLHQEMLHLISGF